MDSLELQDIQGIIIRGYSNLEAACFVLLRIQDAAAARRWLGSLTEQIQTGSERPSETSLNIAFTYSGLVALGLDQQTLDTFSTEFREGMAAPYKSRILGDHGDNAPDLWDWGGPNSDIHILLMLYAIDAAKLAGFYEALAEIFAASGVEQIRKLETFNLRDEQGGFREHFGFRDAIGQPIIAGLSKVGSPDNTVKAGEFILGYTNEYGRLTETPTVSAQQDQQNLLPQASAEEHDLGRNGSYLVFRQLGQKVQEFWRFLDGVTQTNGSSNPEARVKLAAKMVGRWPSGTPLVLAPNQDSSTIDHLENQDEFGYHHSDPHGFKCPMGAHIRRSNPRDSLEPDPGTPKSIAINKTHRLLRRGRAYGMPIAASLNPQDMLEAQDTGERGLHFICISANISRQFEFVQQTWMNNPKFNGLYSESDPLTGDRHPGDGAADQFTEQAQPVRKRVTGLPNFVAVRGGAYFFLPGIRAFRYLTFI